MQLSPAFTKFADEMVDLAPQIEGFLSKREVRFLCLAAHMPPVLGEVLEIGSFQGKSAGSPRPLA